MPFPRRIPAFACSLAIHSTVAGWMLFGPSLSSGDPQPRYQVQMIPLRDLPSKDRRIIWYQFREALPAVSSGQSDRAPEPSPDTRGALSVETLASPAPPRRTTAALPPPPPRAAPKPFVAPRPAPRPAAPAAVAVLPPPEVAAAAAIAQNWTAKLTPALPARPAPKPFRAPEQAAAVAKPAPTPLLPTPGEIPLSSEAAPAPSAASLQSQPSLPAAPEPSGPRATAAVVNTGPVDLARAQIPNESAQARVTIGPEGGAGRGLPAQPGAVTVPGLSVSGERVLEGSDLPVSPPPRAPVPPGVRTAPRAPAPNTINVSVPLWPHARRLNPAVESRLQGRVAYVTVVRPPGARRPGQDWVLWFADREPPRPGARILMRPPVPLPGLAPAAADFPAPAQTAFLAGVITPQGRVDSLALLPPATLPAALLKALAEWEFSPAQRNGVPVIVDVVIEIPGAPPPPARDSGS
jgi:hypothetical protein